MTAFRRNPIYLALRHVRRNAGPLSRRWLAGGMLAPAILLVGAHGVGANDSTTWTGEENSDWFDADNWDEGLPEANTEVVIRRENSGKSNAVVDEGSAVTGNLTINDSNSFFSELLVEGDGSLTSNGRVRIADGTNGGRLQVSGGNASWNHTGALGVTVGTFNAGELIIEDGGTAEIGGSTGLRVAGVATESGEGTVNVTGEDSSLNVTSGDAVIGQQSEGTLTVSDGGTFVTNDLLVGGNDGFLTGRADGFVEVSGSDSEIDVDGDMTVGGDNGDGLMQIEDGASVMVGGDGVIGELGESGGEPASDGEVTVAGSDSTLDIEGELEVGGEGSGELTIQDGGLATSGDSYLGREQFGAGIVTVTGDESSWESETLRIGNRGDAELNILEGARVESDGLAFAAVQEGSKVSITVDGNDSRLISGSLRIGNSGEADLEITDGGSVSSTDGWIGFNDLGDGAVRVSGPESRWDSNNLTVGWNGDGDLIVDSGGEASMDNDLEVAGNPGASGVIRIEGEDSEVDVGGSAEIGVAGDGELHVLDGATMNIESVLGLTDLEEEGSSARVVVSGEDSRLETSFGANLRGRADLEILDGGEVRSGVTTISNRLDTPDKEAARILVEGNDSELQNSLGITIGLNEEGIGKLEIRDGGFVNSTTSAETGARIGAGDSSSQGTVIVTGDNSRWRIVRDAVVGEEGQATLRIEDGGRVFDGSINGNRTLTIAEEHSSSGSVVLEGNESSLDSFGGITVGKRGTGELLIGDGATVDDVGRLNVGGGRSSAIGGGQGSGLLHIDKGGKVDVSGTTSIAENDGSSGTVVVNGELRSGGGVEVGSGGVLAGDGVVRGDVSVQGTLAPGNSIGSLAIEDDGDLSDLTLEDGSIYRVEVNDGGDEAGVNNDHVSVGGNIDIEEQASLHVTSEHDTDDGSTFAPETTYTILSAENGGVEGEFGEVTDDFAFLSTSLDYGEDAVFLTLTQVADLANVAQTSNQRAVASTLDEQVDGEALSDITGAVVMMDEDNARAALDDLSGVDHTHTQQIGLRGAQRFRAGLTGRMPGPGGAQAPRETASLEQLAGLQLASAGQPRGLLDEAADASRGWWVNAEGGRGDIDDTTNATGADYRFTGLTIGFDAPVSNEFHLGAAVGYTRNRGDSASGDIDVDSYHLAAYGGWQRDALYARGSVGLAYHSIDTERFVDTVERNAEADYSARGVGMRAEGGYAFEVGDTARLTPFGGLDYEHLRRSGFSESGAGAANLDVNRESEYSLRSQAGVRFDQAFETTGGWVAPYAEAAWVHEHGDRSSRMDTAFAADTSTRFTIEGPRLSRDRVRVAAGLDARLNEDSFLNVGYQGEIASSDDLHAIGLTFRRNW